MERDVSEGGSAIQKIYTGVAVALLGAVLLGWVATAADVRVNTVAIAEACRRIEKGEAIAARQAEDTAEIKAELREIKAILERMEKQLEGGAK
jgi:hypothetical protein